MISIDVSEDDRAAGRLTGDALRTALDGLSTDGFIVLNDVVEPTHLDVLHERIVADIEALQARPDAPYNWNPGNLQQDPPPFPPYLFADVLLNSFAISVTSAVLGPGLKNVMYGGTPPCPGPTAAGPRRCRPSMAARCARRRSSAGTVGRERCACRNAESHTLRRNR
jgi:hypothetical protein